MLVYCRKMEATGFKFFKRKGQAEDCLKILKDHGMNTVLAAHLGQSFRR